MKNGVHLTKKWLNDLQAARTARTARKPYKLAERTTRAPNSMKAGQRFTEAYKVVSQASTDRILGLAYETNKAKTNITKLTSLVLRLFFPV